MVVYDDAISRDHEILGLPDPQRQHTMMPDMHSCTHATRSCVLKRQYKILWGSSNIALRKTTSCSNVITLTPEPYKSPEPLSYLVNEMFLTTTLRYQY